MPTCCRIQLCCDPPEAAADLSDHEGIPLESAAKILSGYTLIPLAIEAGKDQTTEAHTQSATKRLARLHEHARSELRSILIDMGHRFEK